jgi:hypothetical protein
MYSVFGNKEPNSREGGSTELNIGYSGEPFVYKPDLFALNIVMNHECPNSIMYPLFAIGSYACDYWKDYMRPRGDPADNTKFCSFVVSNGGSMPRRKFFRLLNQYKKVDSFGYCDNNTGVRAPPIVQVNGYDVRDSAQKGAGGYLEFIRGYKFMICFENTQSPYYLTEKLQNAWLSGAIPIYWGASKALEWLNPKAFLYLADDSPESMSALVNRVMYLDQNPEAYSAMHKEPLVFEIHPDLDKNILRDKINAKYS